MVLNAESLEAYKTILDDPKTHGLPIRPWSEIFKESDICTPKHLLFKEVNEKEYSGNLPKIFFYLIGDERFKHGKAETGEFGYYAQYIPAT